MTFDFDVLNNAYYDELNISSTFLKYLKCMVAIGNS